MKSNAHINADSLKNLERAILISGLVVLVSSTVLLLGTGLSHFQFLETKSKLAVTNQEIKTLSETIDKSKKVKFTSNNRRELSVVQATMDRLAKQHRCQLQEVTSTDDTVPFVTRYKKGADERGWKQMAMSGHVIGSLSNVMAFTRGLALMPTPIEIGSIEIAPIGSERDSKVSAKLTFQILKQEVTR
jgi:Tfp pilus assembly protein PilO